MSDINPDRHVFGESPGGETNPHEGTKAYHAAKEAIKAEEALALNMIKARHQREREELAESFRERYRQAAKDAGFR